jgi:AcrR family transcriptional regulator
MATIANARPRPYRSRLRDEQAQGTRDRILDATLRVIASGIASVSIPAVAREAGVSVPTVYRIFGTKRALFEAVYPHSVRRSNRGELKAPTSLAEFRDGLRILFDRIDSMDDVARAAIVSRGAEEVRHATMESRLARSRQAVDAIAPGLPSGGRERMARLLIVLTATASLRMWRDHLGLPVDQAMDEIEWALDAAAAASRSEDLT